MRRLLFAYLLLLVTLFACSKDEVENGKIQIIEDFEGVTTVDALFQNGSWAFVQQTESSSYVRIDSLNPHAGTNCLKVFAAKGTISKSDISENRMSFVENDILQLSAWFYLEGTDDLDYVFLFDIEEKAVIGASPGIRVAIDDNGYLVVERNKYGESTLRQPSGSETPFPRNKWVNIKLELYLQQKKKGYVKLWLDNALLIDAENVRTLPSDKLYTIQGTTGTYQSFQIGVTATSSDKDVTLFVDDIELKVKN